ncbi:MAG: M50 family metallopeptidase [Candidatus Omnitrophica bacterium]|nr:M50 family metallopeptidase [Candidatus Omnitrophota bacterium]MBU4487783.1 M50 family metallopeptidase [Candidatus Omnitrophota bacterium]MCG2705577.1 M50 family metallopeptidase [Candidatus Omnitrophota bacterium]
MAKIGKNNNKIPKRGSSKAGEALKTIIGLLLLPVVVSISLTFYRQFGNFESPWTVGQQYFTLGVAVYCIMHLLVFKPSYFYVLGHESVHALATWMCLGRVKSFKVNSATGSVATTKNNIFISLAPYFVPFYAILLAIAAYVANNVFLKTPLPYKYFLFLLGFTLAFHIIMTIDVLKTKQPDLVKAGYLTSGIIIYAINVIVIAGILGLMTSGFSFTEFMRDAWTLTADIYKKIYAQLFINS